MMPLPSRMPAPWPDRAARRRGVVPRPARTLESHPSEVGGLGGGDDGPGRAGQVQERLEEPLAGRRP